MSNTWGHNLLHEPHLRCVVLGVGLGPNGERRASCRPSFMLPVRVLSQLFHRLFICQLQPVFDHNDLQLFNCLEARRNRAAFAKYMAPATRSQWVVYAKPLSVVPNMCWNISVVTPIA